MQRITFSKEEKHKLIAATLVLAFIFSAKSIGDFWGWIGQFLLMFVLTSASLLVNVLAHKRSAASIGARAKFDLFTIKRLGFTRGAEIKHGPAKTIPRIFYNITTFFTNAWIVLPLLITYFSAGQIPFAAVGITTITTTAAFRLGKKYVKAKEIETAKICVAGPMANILFALIIKALFGLSGIAGTLVLINVAIAISNMIPLFRLDGGQIFFNSLLLYVFSLAFILGSAFLIYFLTAFSTLIISLLIAITIVTLFYYFHIFK